MDAMREQWRRNVEGDTLACGFSPEFAKMGELASELDAMAGDAKATADAFFQDLEFGTAGLRGVIGAGTNRMNVYTVARATQGLADYLNAHFDNPSVAIARDSRHKGRLFVNTAASVLAANGVKAFVYPRVEPTPALSFAVRDLGCSAGINMTASHNPAAYNGYKVYGPDGCQITSDAAAEISARIAALGYFAGEEAPCAKTCDFQKAAFEGMISWIGEDTIARFVEAVLEQSQEEPGADPAPLSLLYTPLCGTGLECVSQVLGRIGIPYVNVVPGQDRPDGDFPTCTYPNPEERAALEAGIAECRAAKAAGRPYDLLLATDPDADRVGVACEDGDDYALISGNEMGILLLDFLASRRAACGEDLSRRVAVTTIVSSAMCDDLAAEYGFELRRTLTGFKYIGEQIGRLEAAGEADRFLFGFEESYGYLAGTHVRDKDAVVASMLIVQMARFYRAQGKTLVQAMRELYAKHGWQTNRTISLSYPGADGAQRMDAIMAGLRTQPPAQVAGRDVAETLDYAEGVGDLPAANVVEFRLTGGGKLIVRPSGTEPKIKAYLFAKAPDEPGADAMLDALEESARALLA
ncbi:MAG TPA: phospho-sugar mutase [Candidatus Aphodovivens avistercoris]|nr:phospho-sugar mutase [Candidatus Aphodovivens avistercoris]